MVKECQDFAKTNNLTFSTDDNPIKSKTKCIIFSKKPLDTTEVKKIILDNKELPWVPSLKHLGMTLESDMAQKRGSFIGKMKSLEQEFCGSSCDVKMRIFEIYTMSFFGSSLYDLFSKEAERIYTTYNKMVRTTFSLPRETHRYFIEEITTSPLVRFQEMLKSSERLSN